MKSDLSNWVDTTEQERPARKTREKHLDLSDWLFFVEVFVVSAFLLYVVMEAACGWC